MLINNISSTATEFKLLMNYRARVRPLQLRLLNSHLQYELQKQQHPMIQAFGELNIDGCPLEVVNSENTAVQDIYNFLKQNGNYLIALHGLKIAADRDQAKALAECHYKADAELIYNLWTKACDEVHTLMQDFVDQSYDTAISAIENCWNNIPTMQVVIT